MEGGDAAGEDADDRERDREIRERLHAPVEFLRIAHAVEDLYVLLLVAVRVAWRCPAGTCLSCAAIGRSCLSTRRSSDRRSPRHSVLKPTTCAASIPIASPRCSQDARQPFGPRGDIGSGSQEIVPDLDHDVGEARGRNRAGGSCSRRCPSPNRAGCRRRRGLDRGEARASTASAKRRSGVVMIPACHGRATPR